MSLFLGVIFQDRVFDERNKNDVLTFLSDCFWSLTVGLMSVNNRQLTDNYVLLCF